MDQGGLMEDLCPCTPALRLCWLSFEALNLSC
jgi:hypothetical protein